MTPAETLDPMAQLIFRAALGSGRSGELLDHLFRGGGVTYDPAARRMVLIPAEMIQQLTEEIR